MDPEFGPIIGANSHKTEGANLSVVAAEALSLRWRSLSEQGEGQTMNRRLYSMLRTAVLDGSLPPSARLPATRELAAELGLSRNTVTHAYDQLMAEGYLTALTGSGTYVTPVLPERALWADAPQPPSAKQGKRTSATLSERGSELVQAARASSAHWGAFVPGVPDVTAFPHRKFGQLLARWRRQPEAPWLSYTAGGGHLHLRETLASYLRQSRSVQCEADQILITEGTHQAFDLVSRLMADQGDLAWVEEPGYWGLRSLLQINGLKIHAQPVDEEGMQIESGYWKTPPRLIFVTPSHQYPLGSVMSLRRRLQLLEQAERYGSWIIEDDYDSEFRYEGHPIPSLQGLVPDARVIYAGTFSKTAYPALRLAYLVLPRSLADAFRQAYPQIYRQGQMSTQAALAEFIEQGHHAAHIRRMRLVYAQRRQMLHDLISRRIGPEHIHPYDSTAGLHLVLQLPPTLRDKKVVEAAASAGIVVRALSNYYQQETSPQGLLLGFACVPENRMLPAFETLLDTIQKVQRNGK